MAPRKKQNIEKIESVEDLLSINEGVLLRGSSEELSYGRIPFSIPVLDNLIGGGIPKKRITILSGQSNSGKSYLASQAVVSVQKAGGLVLWVDNELSWDNDWMKSCGVNTDDVVIAQPTTGEETFDEIKKSMQSGVDLVVLDSISGLVPSNMMNDEDFGFNPIAWQARFINQSIPRIMPWLRHGSAVILINQVRQPLGNVTYIDSLPGGKAQSFFAHLILQVRRSGWITNSNNEKIGFDIEVTNRKTKAGGYSQGKCTVPFKFDGGLDFWELYIRDGIEYGLIDKKGVWYQMFDDETKRFMGMNNLRQHLIDNVQDYDLLVEMVNKQSISFDDEDNKGELEYESSTDEIGT